MPSLDNPLKSRGVSRTTRNSRDIAGGKRNCVEEAGLFLPVSVHALVRPLHIRA